MAYREKAKEGGLDGIFVLQPGCESRLYSLNFGGTTVFRPYPCPCPDPQDGFFPARLTTTRCDFSDFAEIAEGVAFNGQHRKLTYISEWAGMSDVDESPSKRLYRVISAAIKNRSHMEWIDYIKGPNDISKNAFIKRPSSYLFLQGFLKLHGGKTVDKHGVVLMVKQSGRKSFEDLMSEPNSEYKHPGDNSAIDLDKFFKYPDPTDISNGRYLVVTPRVATKEVFGGYDITIGDPCPLDGPSVRKAWKPWEQVLRYMTVEEQVKLLISAFPKPLIYYAFSDTKLLPESFIEEYMKEQQAAQAIQGGYAPTGQAPTQQPTQQPQGGNVQNESQTTQPATTGAAPTGGPAPFTTDEPKSDTLPGYPEAGQGSPGASAAELAGIAPSHETQPQQEATPTYMGEAVASQEAMTPEAMKALEQLTGMNQSFKDGSQAASGDAASA